MPAAIPRDDLLAELRRLGNNGDSPPSQREMRSDGAYTPDPFKREFGSWADALAAAGYDLPRPRRKDGSRERVAGRLRDVAADIGHPPSGYELKNHDSDLSKRQVYNYFESWSDALATAGLDDDRPTRCRDCDHDFESARAWSIHRSKIHGEDAPDVGVLEAIHELADDGSAPTQAEMHHRGAYSVDVYTRMYGSWTAALREAGYDPSRDAHNRIPTEDLLGEIRRLAKRLNHTPTSLDMAEQGQYSIRPYRRRFSSWIAAQEAAGVAQTRLPPGEGDGSPSYQGGWDTARKTALERDDYECQDCGRTDDEQRDAYGCGLNVHHKKRYRTFDDPEQAHKLSNLITLCQPCHTRRHAQ